MDLLDKGLQHNTGNREKKQGFEHLLVDTEVAIENLDVTDKTALKTYCAYQLKKEYKKAIEGKRQDIGCYPEEDQRKQPLGHEGR